MYAVRTYLFCLKKIPCNITEVYLVSYIFYLLALPHGQGHHNSVSQLLWAHMQYLPPCQLSLLEEPRGNPRLSVERWLILFLHEDWFQELVRIKPMTLEVKGSAL